MGHIADYPLAETSVNCPQKNLAYGAKIDSLVGSVDRQYRASRIYLSCVGLMGYCCRNVWLARKRSPKYLRTFTAIIFTIKFQPP